MSQRRDPPRLKDESHGEWPAGFREALAGYAGSAPSAEICEKVIERVETRIASQAAGGSWKLPWLTSGIVVVVGIAAWFGYEHLHSLNMQRHGAAVSASRTPALRVAPTPPMIEAVSPPVRVETPTPAGEIAPAAGAEPTGSVRATLHQRSKGNARPRAKTVPSVGTATPAPVHPATSDPRAELALLIRARSILSSEPAQALALVKAHAAQFPQSGFEEEREVLAIDAERRLGHTHAAAERARLFLQNHPSSIHRPSVEPIAEER